MLTTLLPQKQTLPLTVEPGRSIVLSLFLPFEPVMMPKTVLSAQLTSLKSEAEILLQKQGSLRQTVDIMKRLSKLIQELDYSTHKKSLAIYVTAIADKVFYLDMFLEQRVAVDNCYNIRSLVESKKILKKYLVLSLNEDVSKIYEGLDTSLSCALKNQVPLTKAGETCYDPIEHHLQKVDASLSILLEADSCPLFVVGTPYVITLFKNFTRNKPFITEWIETNEKLSSGENIAQYLQPFLKNWTYIKYKFLLRKLLSASANEKLAEGINDVLPYARHKRGKLLLVERDFSIPAVGEEDEEREAVKAGCNRVFRDLADEVIEAVLQSGGDVEFVEPPLLRNFDHIALVHR